MRLLPILHFAALPLLSPPGAAAQGTPSDTVRVAIAAGVPADARRGAVMSVEESARVAGLLRRAIVLDTGRAAGARAQFTIVAGAASPGGRAILLEVGCAPAAAGERPARWFTLCPPPASRTATHDSVVAWDATLEKFGASQLNDRYRARWHAPMTEDAWRGWLAAKIAWESALRGPRDPAALARWLASPKARFDGHQGAPLAFDAQHRLRHPRYRVAHRGATRMLEPLP